MYRRRSASIQIDIVETKRRDFELKFVFYNNDHAEMSANSMRARKNFLHLFGSCIRHNINVLGRATADHVADAPAGEVGHVAMTAQARTNLSRRFFHERCFHLLQAIHRTARFTLRERSIEVNRPSLAFHVAAGSGNPVASQSVRSHSDPWEGHFTEPPDVG